MEPHELHNKLINEFVENTGTMPLIEQETGPAKFIDFIESILLEKHNLLLRLEENTEKEIRHLEWMARRRSKKCGQDGFTIQLETDARQLRYHWDRIKKRADK